MQIVRACALLISLPLVACGDDGGTKLIDSGIGNTDTPPKVCTNVSVGMGDIDGETATSFISFFNNLNEQVDGLDAQIYTEFYHSVTPNITGAIDVAMGANEDYATCGVCFLVAAFDDSTVKYFYQQSGTVTFTEDPITARRLNLTVSNLRLQEATIDNTTFESTLTPNGDCVTLNGTFMEDNVPNNWSDTCTKTDYYEATATAECDCSCGVYDQDCRAPGAGTRTTGCTTAGMGACWPADPGEPGAPPGTACVPLPANDTCAGAVTLAVDGATATGTMIGASRDYTQPRGTTNTCTTFTQGGPDVVYKTATLTAGMQYTVTLTNNEPRADLSLTIVGPYAAATECLPSNTTCVAGRDMNSFGMGEAAIFTPTANGVYYVIVDTRATAPVYNADPAMSLSLGGTFTINLTQP